MDADKYLQDKYPQLTEEQQKRVLEDVNKKSLADIMKNFFADTLFGSVSLVLTIISVFFLSNRSPYVQIIARVVNSTFACLWVVHASFRYIVEYEYKRLPSAEVERLNIALFNATITFPAIMFVDYASGSRPFNNQFFLGGVSMITSVLMMTAILLFRNKVTCWRLDALEQAVEKELTCK